MNVADTSSTLFDEPGDAARWNMPEARRERRARNMEQVRIKAVEVAACMADAMTGRIPADECPMFGRINDPVASFANLNRAIIQIAMYEDRLDESAEERAARLAAETAAHEQAARNAEAQRGHAQSQIDLAERKAHIQRAMREITLDSWPDLSGHNREDALDDLFFDYDFDDNARWDRDAAEIVHDLCARAGIELVPVDPTLGNHKRDPADRMADALALAKRYLDATVSRGGDSAESPSEQAQGPPH